MVNVRMWGKAIVRMPRISNEEWKGLDIVSRWLISARAAVLWMTLFACLFGGVVAAIEGHFDARLFLVTTVGLMMAHATNNFVNDLTDHWKGTDKGNYFRAQYGVQPLEQGVMSKREFYIYMGVTGAIALACGAYLVHERAGHVLMLLGMGAFFVLFYTYPLKYYGFGEFAVVAVWGPLMVGGTHYVITGAWSAKALLMGFVYCLSPTQVIFGKHIDKIVPDTGKRIRTLPVILGGKSSQRVVQGVMLVQALSLVPLVAFRIFSPTILVALVSLDSLRKVWRIYNGARPADKPNRRMGEMWPLWFSAWSFLHSSRFAFYLLMGLYAEVALRHFHVLP